MSINHTEPRLAQPAAPRATVAVTGQARSTHGPLPEVALTMTDHAGAQLARTYSGPDGRFRFPEVSAGTYVLIASRVGYQPQAETLVLDSATAEPVLLLTPASGVHGTVHDRSSGRPVAAAAISAVGPTGDVLASTMSDPDGKYRVTGIVATTITLVVAAAEADPVATVVRLDTGGASPERTVDIAVDTHSALTGRVTVRGSAAAGLPLTLRDQDGHIVDTAVTDEAGQYRFERITAGSYTLRSSTRPAQTTAVSREATNADVYL